MSGRNFINKCRKILWHNFLGVESSIQRYLWKSLCFSLLLFTVWWSTFKKPFRRLLPLSCIYGSTQWLFKAKIICKGASFIWIWIRFGYVPYNFCYPSFLLWSTAFEIRKKFDSKLLPSIFASSKEFRRQKFSCLFLLAALVPDCIILHS